jgi:protein-S-isoprenylcysteine O-methyltransferase Ste14
MLAVVIRFIILTVCLVFLAGMQVGFAPGRGREALRGVLLAAIAASVGAALHFGWSVPDPSPWLAGPGAALAAAGCGLFVWCLVYHPRRPGKAFAAAPPATVVSGGPYRLARHPIYLSYLLALGGAALLAHSWGVAGLGAWMAALYWYAARMEERLILASPHAAGYAAYMRRVGPFWPRWRAASPAVRSRVAEAPVAGSDAEQPGAAPDQQGV